MVTYDSVGLFDQFIDRFQDILLYQLINILTNYVYHINYYQRALSSYHYLIIVATMHLCVCNRVAEFILIKSEYI